MFVAAWRCRPVSSGLFAGKLLQPDELEPQEAARPGIRPCPPCDYFNNSIFFDFEKPSAVRR